MRSRKQRIEDLQENLQDLQNLQDLHEEFFKAPTPELVATIYDLMKHTNFSQGFSNGLLVKTKYIMPLINAMQKLAEVDTIILERNPDLIDESKDSKIIYLLSEASKDLAQFPFQSSSYAFVFWQLAGTIFRHLCFMPNHVQNSEQNTQLLFQIAGFMSTQKHDSLMSLNNERAHICFLNSIRQKPENLYVWFMLTRTMTYYQETKIPFLHDDKDIFGDEINTWEKKIIFAEARLAPPVELSFPIAVSQPPQILEVQVVDHPVYCMVETQLSNFVHPQNLEDTDYTNFVHPQNSEDTAYTNFAHLQNSEDTPYTNFVHNDRMEEDPRPPVRPGIARQRGTLFYRNPADGCQLNITVNVNLPPAGL